MAEVNANIPLSVQQLRMPTAQDIAAQKQMEYRNQLAQMQIQGAQQAAQSRNALLDIFKQPGAMDEQGMPTQATIGRVMQQDPTAGFQLQESTAKLQEQRQRAIENSIHTKLLGLQVTEKQASMLKDVATDTQIRYEDLIKSGKSPAQAAVVASKERNDALDNLEQTGIFPKDQNGKSIIDGMRKPFNPEGNKAFISSYPGYLNILKERNQEAKEKRAESREERMTRAAENKPSEEKKTPFMKELAAIYGEDSPEYKKAMEARIAKETGGGAGGQGSRAEVYFNRIVSAGNEATAAAKNIMELPVSASRGMFGGRQQGGSILSAAKESLTNAMTSQEVQDYNTMIAGVARNLAAIEAGGLAPAGSLTHSMDAVVLKSGDSYMTKMRKMAELRQIVEKGLEPNLANPRISPEQKGEVRRIIDDMKGAVPFTQHDVTMLQQSKKSSQTMQDFVKKSGMTASVPEGIPQGSKKIGKTPDGKPVWQSPNGKKWVE